MGVFHRTSGCGRDIGAAQFRRHDIRERARDTRRRPEDGNHDNTNSVLKRDQGAFRTIARIRFERPRQLAAGRHNEAEREN